MKLIYRVTLRLAAVLLPILFAWAVIFYYSMVDEINDETDDSLEDYAELIIRRTLTGHSLPSQGDGSNNTYTIELLPDSIQYKPEISFTDKRIYIPEKRETEPARVITVQFLDENSRAYRLTVSTPTFEREDLLEAVLIHIIILYIALLLTVLTVTALVFHYSMRPLYSLLRWLDRYHPGKGVEDLPDEKSVIEFRKLTNAARHTIERAEKYMERQTQFIGNASHELQTPLAIIGTRIEWITDNTPLTDEQFAELSKIRHSLHRLARLNRTLLLLTKIDNGQFPEKSDVEIAELVENEIEVYTEIYSDKGIKCTTHIQAHSTVKMDESLANTLVTNLLKNAFLHTAENGCVHVEVDRNRLTVANSGSEALDKSRLFDRFYTSGKSGSTGLGLALVKSIANNYGFTIRYEFKKEMHRFTVEF